MIEYYALIIINEINYNKLCHRYFQLGEGKLHKIKRIILILAGCCIQIAVINDKNRRYRFNCNAMLLLIN